MMRFLIIDFPQNICNDDYYIICLLCRNCTSLHCSMLSTRCMKATACAFFNWQKNQVAFLSDLLVTYVMHIHCLHWLMLTGLLFLNAFCQPCKSMTGEMEPKEGSDLTFET